MKPIVEWLVLSLLMSSAHHAAGEWTELKPIRYPSGNLSFRSAWDPDQGLHLKVAGREPGCAAVIELTRRGGKLSLSPASPWRRDALEEVRFFTNSLPATKTRDVAVLLRLRPEAWSLYLGGNLAAILPPPFPVPAALYQAQIECPDAGKAEAAFQRAENFRFHDDFMVPDAETSNQLKAWEIQSGTWRVHSVLDEAEAEKQLQNPRKGRALKPEFSPNFYSLSGQGTSAVIVAGYDFYDRYSLRAAVHTTPGEAGLVFLATDPANYFGFTLRLRDDTSTTAILSLWRRSSGGGERRDTLGAVSTKLTTGQWVMLRVRLFENRVQCYMDNTMVMDVPVLLPAGGRFGLYADAEEEVLFDDVTAGSNTDLDLRSRAGIRFHALDGRGQFFSQPWYAFFVGESDALTPPRSRQPQWLAVGSPLHNGHVFSATFEPLSSRALFGLLVGFQAASQPYLRFVCDRSPAGEIFRLEQVTGERVTGLEELRLPAGKGSRPPERATLMSDATADDELRLYRNGQLVLIHRPAASLNGASGLYVGPGTEVRISALSYRAERDDLYRNRFEKNRVFAQDAFMRHWSSPEGEWVADEKTGLLWHKSDFFGRFQLVLPVVSDSEIHLGVREGETNGALVIRMSKDGLALQEGADGSERPPQTVAQWPPRPPGTNEAVCRIAYEGYWLQATVGTNLLIKRSLAAPLTGTRIRMAGGVTNRLGSCFEERYDVKDYLFDESPYEWTINGGRWEIINRFQCDPRWSHLNAESKDGLAALWTKYRFKGDFCVEMYAGMRHGWYSRCGDMNMTVMSPQTTPSQGYTVTCTGWDYDQSQLFSRLYRNGRVMDETDKYLAPREREGNKRKRLDTLVPAGRDVHGAWYYIKLRRIGRKLEYYFDNELVFSREDADLLDDGLVGIWTFMNSIMIARVKVAASEITPSTIAYAALPPAAEPPRTAGAAPTTNEWAVRWNPLPLEIMQPSCWGVEDAVGHSDLSWGSDTNGSRFLTVRNTLGSGPQFVRCHLPPVPYRDLAGWRFRVRRSARSLFNFYFSMGRPDAAGQFVPQRRFFHRISGPGFSEGEFQSAGETPVPGVAPAAAMDRAPWTAVEVWLPAEGLAKEAGDPASLVRVEGFGILHPSYELEGLFGNGPGEWYGVSDFCPVVYGIPRLAVTNAGGLPVSFSFSRTPGGRPVGSAASVSEAQDWLRRFSRDGVNSVWLGATSGGALRRGELGWIQLPSRPSLSCGWSATEPGAVVLKSSVPYPDRRFAFATLKIGDAAVPLASVSHDTRTGLVPRTEKLGKADLPALSLRVNVGQEEYPFSLAWQDARAPEPPVLLRLEGLTPFFENLESRTWGRLTAPGPGLAAIRDFDPVQGSYLEVRNRELGNRLKTVFRAGLSLADYPIFRFRYRAQGMVRISLGLQNAGTVKLSEDYGGARSVAYAPGFELDGQWHTWWGRVSDAVSQSEMDLRMFVVEQIAFGSYHGVDQTGRFSRWDVDDLAVGPAVSRAEQLAFTPEYFDFDGVRAVFWAVVPQSGAAGTRPEPVWRSISNGRGTVPDIEHLEDGIHGLLLKAVDNAGLESAVTEIPFILDRKPVTVTHAFEESTEPLSNGTLLRIRFQTGQGVPLALEDLQIKWNDKPAVVAPFLSRFSHAPSEDVLVLNWPYVFRAPLDKMPDGGRANIVVANIRDGAGNRAADCAIPLVMDYSKDRTPPTVLATKYPTNVFLATAWEARANERVYFEPYAGDPAPALQRQKGEEPYLAARVRGKEKAGGLMLKFADPKWGLTRHPFLSFRMRRPAMTAGEATRIAVAVELSNDQKYSIPLTRPEAGTNTVNLPAPLPWQSNQWQSVTLDLVDLLKPKLAEKVLQTAEVKVLYFQCENAPENMPFDLQSLFVCSKWKPEDVIRMDAYDASGIDGIVLEGGVRIGGTEMAPAASAANAPPGGWRELRVRDKAGNVSLPVRVPVP